MFIEFSFFLLSGQNFDSFSTDDAVGIQSHSVYPGLLSQKGELPTALLFAKQQN
jgi:hypothetical protein